MSASVHKPLKIAVSFGALSPQVSRLLARQGDEEPQTPVVLQEVCLDEQLRGLEEGRYDGGLALTSAPDYCLRASPLWHDEVAVALPKISPLLAFPAVPVEEIQRYPIVRWCDQACAPLSQIVDSLLDSLSCRCHAASAQTYELMAALVGAGYGIGLGSKSRIAAFRNSNVIMRPLDDPPQKLITYFLHPIADVPATARFVERAKAIASNASYPPGTRH